jgi:hypothetical protein
VSKAKPVASAGGAKKVATQSMRIAVPTAKKIKDLAEFKGVPEWQALDELLAANLDAEWTAALPRLKKIRELAAKQDAIRAEARGPAA